MRPHLGPDGLIRIALKKQLTDGSAAGRIEMIFMPYCREHAALPKLGDAGALDES